MTKLQKTQHVIGYKLGKARTKNCAAAYAVITRCGGAVWCGNNRERTHLMGLRSISKIQFNTVSCPCRHTRTEKVCILSPDRAPNYHRTGKHRPVIGITNGNPL